MNFYRYKDHFQTGDIILYGGRSFLSYLIKLFGWSPWSHVGIVVKLSKFDKLLFFQTTPSKRLKDVILKKNIQGVQINFLEDFIKNEDGTVAWRRLKAARNEELRDGLQEYISDSIGKPYEKDLLEIARANYDGPLGGNEEETLDSLFCSELVAEAYQQMGLLPCDKNGGRNSNEYTPKDFCSMNDLKLLNGAQLEDEIILK